MVSLLVVWKTESLNFTMRQQSSIRKGRYFALLGQVVSAPHCLYCSSEDVTILKNSTHTGTLKALDFNLFQTNLLASAGSNSEVAKKRDVDIMCTRNK